LASVSKKPILRGKYFFKHTPILARSKKILNITINIVQAFQSGVAFIIVQPTSCRAALIHSNAPNLHEKNKRTNILAQNLHLNLINCATSSAALL